MIIHQGPLIGRIIQGRIRGRIFRPTFILPRYSEFVGYITEIRSNIIVVEARSFLEIEVDADSLNSSSISVGDRIGVFFDEDRVLIRQIFQRSRSKKHGFNESVGSGGDK